MRKLFCYIMAVLLMCQMTACVIIDGGSSEPTESDAPSSAQTDPSIDPQDPTVDTTAPDSSTPAPSVPAASDPVQTQPTMPDVGQDPGGFGPIF